MGSLKDEDMKKLYHILDPLEIYDKSYLTNFAKKNEEPFKMIQGWRVLDSKFKDDKRGMYPVASLIKPLQLCNCYVIYAIWIT